VQGPVGSPGRNGQPEATPAARAAALAENLDGIASYLRHTADYERSDRLWPANFLVFSTNPLSVAYGACGPAMFLYRSGGGRAMPPEVLRWLRNQSLSVERYPPGLYLGLAGIAYTYWEIGLVEEAEAAMAMLYESPLRFDEPGMLLGAAGWGLVSLHLFSKTGRQEYLAQAAQAGDNLLETVQHQDETCYWRCNQDGRVHYGYGYGASGVALFLLQLYRFTGQTEYLTHAVGGLEFDLANRVMSEVGWQWRRFEDDAVLYPYWIHGSAGVGSTLIRFHHLLGVDRYRDLAHRIASDTLVTFASAPGQFDGLAGIGELMLDLFQVTGDETYRGYARHIAEAVLCFRIDRAGGAAYPGRSLMRISNDYATGSAGVGLFLARLLRPQGRAFVDIDDQVPTVDRLTSPDRAASAGRGLGERGEMVRQPDQLHRVEYPRGGMKR
jgi:hypothetical protein